MARFDTEKGTIAYDDTGAGAPVLLLLHAFPLDRSMWEETARDLAGASRVLRFDARGFGGSEPVPETLTMDTIASDAIALLDHLSIARVVACGLSMGGYAALALARARPDRLAGMILADTRAAADTEEARAGRMQLIEKLRARGTPALEEALLERLLGTTTRRDRPELVDQVRRRIRRVRPEAAIAALRGLAARADSTELLPDLALPVLFVCGAEDAITPPAEALAMQRATPASRYVEIPDAGHLSNLENPVAFRDAVRAFVAG